MNLYKFASVSTKPGSTGTFFYKEAFKLFNYNAEYSAIKCYSIYDVGVVIQSGEFSGVSVTSPFKKPALNLCSKLDGSAISTGSVNTIKINRSEITGFNTDSYGVTHVLKWLSPGTIKILGEGALCSIFSQQLKLLNKNFTIYSRKRGNWENREAPAVNIINCTTIGMGGLDSPLQNLHQARVVIDLVIGAKALRDLSVSEGVQYISGLDFYEEVFRRQFEVYTGIKISKSNCNLISGKWKNLND